MPGRLGKTTNWPDDITGQQTLDERQSQWGEISGKIVSYDKTKQTATVKPLYKPRHNGKAVEMPELYEVPVRMQRSGGGGLTFPVKKGDYVTMRTQMRSSENYHDKEDGAASDARSFSVADYEAHLAGGESLKNPIQNCDGDNVHLRFSEDGKMGIRGDTSGKIQVEGSKIKLQGSQGDLMDLARQISYWAAQTNNRLKQEPALVFRPDYALFEGKFNEIMAKLQAMTVT
jgi:Phage protein Gp138 N-terminal domain